MQQSGIKVLEDYIIKTRTVIPDFTLKKTSKLFGSDSVAITIWVFTGTYTSENDLPSTGKKLEIPGFSVLFFNGNKLTGEWIAFSDLTIMKQLIIGT